MNPSVKPVALLCAPRSGSTPYYHILNRYYAARFGIRPLHGLLLWVDTLAWDTGNGIFVHHVPPELFRSAPPANTELNLRMRSDVLEYRLQLLKKYGYRYTVKVHGSHLPLSIAKKLRSKFLWVATERWNVFQQMLSYVISLSTGVWYADKGLQIAPGSIKADLRLCQRFEEEFFLYHLLKNTLRPRHILRYEDLFSRTPVQILHSVGLKNTQGLQFSLPSIQNPRDKLPLFDRPERLTRFYRRSALHSFRSLEECSRN
jgi:hypothetical protein